MKILIVEDDENKLNNLKKFVEEQYNTNVFIEVKYSFQSGLEAIISNEYDILLLDMSLPNFDLENTHDSGAPLSKGGELILYEMDILNINLKTIIVTQHDDFEGESLEAINNEYKERFPNFYCGYVFYNAIESNWEKDLKIILNGVYK